MNVAFRVDASDRIGTGHLVRCLTLAEALRTRGARVRFVCRAHPGHMIELLRGRGINVCALPASQRPLPQAGLEDYVAWLGTTEEEDADQTIAALEGEALDWLVVDHYALGSAWEQRLRGRATKLMVIDDIANRAHDCDLLLDQNYSHVALERYRGLVPSDCKLCVTPRYALLSPEYVEYRRALPMRSGRVSRVLIFFGGSDPHDVTGRALQALCEPQFSQLAVDVVIGANNPNREALLQASSARPLTRAHGPRNHLADLMAQADLAIGAGGITAWERMCLGLPSVVVSIADNQRPACEALRDDGLIRYVGHYSEVQVSDIAGAVADCMQQPELTAALSERLKTLVDGLGTSRIAEYLHPSVSESLRLRPAAAEDMLLYFEWANDPDVRHQALATQPIPLDEHRAWFAARLEAKSSHLFVMQAGDLPVGQIRFDLSGSVARIDYSIDAMFRGRGWARQLVKLGMRKMSSLAKVVFRAEVKESNPPSKAVFTGLGFADATSEADAGRGLRTYVFDPAA